ncbi:MAG: AI-2E family transporter [Candidatus Neomarinimicrobiota bacterium]|nr:MAG: AI-2E family transporter [Candidatus Neomarinimicrobiota bacterium]
MTTPKDPLLQIYRLLITLIGVGFLYVIWPYISSVVVLLVFAFLLTTILLPGVDTLERKIKSRGMSVLLVTVGLAALITLFIASFASGLYSQGVDFSQQINNQDYQNNLMQLVNNVRDALPPSLQDMLPQESGEKGGLIGSVLKNLSGVLQNLLSVAGAIGSFIFNFVMVLIFTVILLYEYHNFKRSLVRFISNKYFEIGLRLIFNIERAVSSYLRGQLLAASSVGIMSIIGLVILNMFGANLTLVIFIGIIAGLANLIPLVGPFVGMVPAMLIAVMNNLGNEAALHHHLFSVIPSPFYLLDIVLMFIIVQQIDNNFVTPMLVGESVGLHPMLVMIALLIGGTLLGPLGMLFAVPAAGVLKVIGQEWSFVSKNAHLL